MEALCSDPASGCANELRVHAHSAESIDGGTTVVLINFSKMHGALTPLYNHRCAPAHTHTLSLALSFSRALSLSLSLALSLSLCVRVPSL